jgi:hypothetical protein
MRSVSSIRAVVCSMVFSLVAAFPAVSAAEDHVNPKCCNYPARPSGIKIQFFLEACAVPGETARGIIANFDCQSYVLGVIDTYRQLNQSIQKSKNVCPPADITTKDVLELMWSQYPNWNIPETRQASEVILEVLRRRFSCFK